MQFAWLLWSLLLLLIWGGVYLFLTNKTSRKEMLVVSLWTSLLGLTEPIFVPEYWNPLSLFDLARTTGFDIESIIFSFGVGGIAVIVYESFYEVKHVRVSKVEQQKSRHKFHLPILFSAPLIFVFLLIFSNLNPIYSTVIALISGGLLTWYCRPDLKMKMLISAFIFLGIYFIYFQSLIYIFPGYVEEVWNLSAISGILILGVPFEELMFAFALGFLWSSVYEHVTWNRIQKVT